MELILEACMCAKLLQSCPTLCDSMDCNSPGSSVHGIPQARVVFHALLQGIFLIQVLNPCLFYQHWQVGSLPLAPPGKLLVWKGLYGNPLQYSCLENPRDRGALQATVHRVAKSRTRLSSFHFPLTSEFRNFTALEGPDPNLKCSGFLLLSPCPK